MISVRGGLLPIGVCVIFLHLSVILPYTQSPALYLNAPDYTAAECQHRNYTDAEYKDKDAKHQLANRKNPKIPNPKEQWPKLPRPK